MPRADISRYFAIFIATYAMPLLMRHRCAMPLLIVFACHSSMPLMHACFHFASLLSTSIFSFIISF
jgi:hypothetical protein